MEAMTAGAEPPRPPRRLLLRIYGLGIATMVAVAGTMIATRVARERVPRYVTATTTYALRGAGEHLIDGTLPAYVAELQREADLEISVYDARGALLASNVQPPLDAPTPAEAARALVGVVTRRDAVLVAIRHGGALLGFGVGHHRRPPPPRDPRWEVAVALAWIGLAALLLSRMLGRPLEKIAAAARAFGRGDLSVRTGVVRGDEIGEVARAFDEMSERIATLMETQRELLASVSHELRTPLARIRVALDLAAEGDAETARASLLDVTADLAELEALISDIFSAARLEVATGARASELIPLSRADLEVESLVGKAVERMRAKHPERLFRLDDALARGAHIDGDAMLLRRALENVLENAEKYSLRGTEVRTRVAREDDRVVITVSDQGFGIAPRDLPLVFSPFFRADRSRTRATGGVGLGLTLAKRVVEAHGGTITLDSQLDLGTAVTFRLPATFSRLVGN
jgi:two-component system OmpR family sensor kinase